MYVSDSKNGEYSWLQDYDNITITKDEGAQYFRIRGYNYDGDITYYGSYYSYNLPEDIDSYPEVETTKNGDQITFKLSDDYVQSLTDAGYTFKAISVYWPDEYDQEYGHTNLETSVTFDKNNYEYWTDDTEFSVQVVVTNAQGIEVNTGYSAPIRLGDIN